MKRFLIVAAFFVSAPATAGDEFALAPTGLPFKPEAPRALPSDHPLHGSITLAGIETLPERLGPAKRDAFVAAVGDTLLQLEMRAADSGKARFRLTPVWIRLESPFRISIRNRATVHMRWRLTRADSGQVIFDREIATSAESSGGSAAERVKGVERIALTTNIASAMACLDKRHTAKPPPIAR